MRKGVQRVDIRGLKCDCFPALKECPLDVSLLMEFPGALQVGGHCRVWFGVGLVRHGVCTEARASCMRAAVVVQEANNRRCIVATVALYFLYGRL